MTLSSTILSPSQLHPFASPPLSPDCACSPRSIRPIHTNRIVTYRRLIQTHIMPAGYVTDSDDDTDQLEAEGSGDETDESAIPGALQSANCRVWSTRELYERMNKGLIDVAPPYQRDVVWPKSSQSALIDSILKNKWVPTLLFSERPAYVDSNGKRHKARWVCMDGKQRLTSIKLFLDGVIPWYRKPKQPLYFQSSPANVSRKIISEDVQQTFLTRGLTAAMYNQLTELQERDIFRLVQEGKPLTVGEKMHASAGPWGDYADELTEEYMLRNQDKPNGWCGRITNLRRGADFKTMTHMLLLIRDISVRAPNPPRYLTTMSIQKELDSLSTTAVPPNLKTEVKALLDIFMEISTLAPPRTQFTIELNTPDALFSPIQKGKKTLFSPVEMVWIPWLIHCHGFQLSKGKLLEAIELFKVDVRNRFPNEVKNNGDVTRWMINWIDGFDRNRIKGKYVGYAVPRPTPQPAEPETTPGAGLQDIAKRGLPVQPSQKRDAPAPDLPVTSSPIGAPVPLFKKPRHSIGPPTPSSSSLSPVSSSHPPPNPPQSNPLQVQSSQANIPQLPPSQSPFRQSNILKNNILQNNQSQKRSSSFTGAADRPGVTSMNGPSAQAQALVGRAQAATNGTPIASNLLTSSHSPQSVAWQMTNKPNNFSPMSDPNRSASIPLAAHNVRLVPNYLPPSTRSNAFQLPVKPPTFPAGSAPQSQVHSSTPFVRFSSTPGPPGNPHRDGK